MPSPIPNPLWGAVGKPDEEKSHFGCVNCIAEGVHAGQEVIYFYGGYSMCMKHVQNAIQKAQNANSAHQ